MRVAQIVKTPQRRGAETFAFQLSEELERRGHSTSILYLYRCESAAPLPLRPQDVVLGVDHPLAERSPGIQPGLLWRLHRRLRSFAPDVVQVNGSRSVKYGTAARRLARRRWPLVARVIGSPRDWAGGALKRRLYRTLVLSALDGAVVVSQDSLDGLRETYGLSVPSVIVPRGVDPAAVQPNERPSAVRRSLAVGEDDSVLLYVGSLSREKRLDRLLRVFARVRAEMPGVRLWIAGAGPLETEVREAAGRLGLGDTVTLLGVVEAVGDLLAAADLLLLTSDSEGTPGVVLEAALSSLPVVATRVGGVPECVLDGETGLLVEPNDEAGLAAATVALLLDPARRREIGARARRRAAALYSIEGVTGSILDFYRQRLEAMRHGGRG